MNKLKKYTLVLSTLMVLLVVSGCEEQSSVVNTQASVQHGSIEMVDLEDGTRCAVFRAFKAGGLSCDWKND